MKFGFRDTLFICIMCIICFSEYCFRYFFLKILKDKDMYQSNLFSLEELNIEDVLPLFKRVSLFCNHDS